MIVTRPTRRMLADSQTSKHLRDSEPAAHIDSQTNKHRLPSISTRRLFFLFLTPHPLSPLPHSPLLLRPHSPLVTLSTMRTSTFALASIALAAGAAAQSGYGSSSFDFPFSNASVLTIARRSLPLHHRQRRRFLLCRYAFHLTSSTSSKMAQLAKRVDD